MGLKVMPWFFLDVISSYKECRFFWRVSMRDLVAVTYLSHLPRTKFVVVGSLF